MKKLIFIFSLFISFISFGQRATIQSIVDLSISSMSYSNTTYVLTVTEGGIEHTTTINPSGVNTTVQTLTGTAPAWNVTNGIHATLTVSGNTIITMSNCVAGTSGNITVTSPATAYTLKFTGYTRAVSPVLTPSAGVVTLSGGSNVDEFSWYYDGTYLVINGTKDYEISSD